MEPRFLVHIDLNNPEADLDLSTIAYLSALLIDVEAQNFELALKFIQDHCDLLNVCCDCSVIQNPDRIITLLNAGCSKTFVNDIVLESLVEEGLSQDYFDRLGVKVSSADSDESQKQAVLRSVDKHHQTIHEGLTLSGDVTTLETIRSKYTSSLISNHFYLRLSHDWREHFPLVSQLGLRAIIPSNLLTNNVHEKDTKIFLPRLITDFMQSDRPDGLIPTVVSDEQGVSLGLVYSNTESVEHAVQTGRGVYYSRSRKGLWVKGEESGNTQQLLKIALDCDTDALQFKVRQAGEGKPTRAFSYNVC